VSVFAALCGILQGVCRECTEKSKEEEEEEEGNKGGLVVFVEGALPGEELTAEISKVKKSFAHGMKMVTRTTHDGAVDSICAHFGQCGGCSLQNLAYENQLMLKKKHVVETYRKIAGVEEVGALVQNIGACAMEYGYRNKVEFSCTSSGIVGMHVRGYRDHIVQIDECSIQTREGNLVLREMIKLLESSQLLQARVLEHIVIRWSVSRREILVNLVTKRNYSRMLVDVAQHLGSGNGQIRGIVNSVSDDTRPLEERRITEEVTLYGQGDLMETLGDVSYRISPNSFFQTNTPQAAEMYEYIVSAAQLSPSDTVFDLYCGIGSITLFLAKHCKTVYGVEVHESSIKDAKYNAEMNNINNAVFLKGDASNFADLIGDIRPDVVVVDPARSGLSKKAINNLKKISCSRIVYVSCNVSTQARDIRQLMQDSTFRIESVKPFDLFPQTTHVEVVTVLQKACPSDV